MPLAKLFEKSIELGFIITFVDPKGNLLTLTKNDCNINLAATGQRMDFTRVYHESAAMWAHRVAVAYSAQCKTKRAAILDVEFQ